MLSDQLLQDRCADQPFLHLAHVVFGLRFDERLFNQQNGLADFDLVGPTERFSRL